MSGRPLEGKTALVTGASRLNGIGAAVAKKLAEKGANIYFTTWSPYDKEHHTKSSAGDGERLLAMIRSVRVQAGFEEIDLSNPNVYPGLLERASKNVGTPSILVNNACFSLNHSIWELDQSILDRHYEVNVRTTALLSIAFARQLTEEKGSIIHLTSGQSKGPMLGELAYAATKGAIEALTLTMAAELGEKGITVNAVNPGPTDTGWMSSELKEALLPQFPLGRLGTPEDAANIIAFLATPEAEWVTGQVIHSEGGFIRK